MTSAQYARASEMWESGVPAKLISADLGVPLSTLLCAARYHHDDFSPRRPRKNGSNSDERERSEALAMWRSGKSTYEVAREIGRSQSTVSRWKVAYGWER